MGFGIRPQFETLQSSGRECKSENDEAMDDVVTVGVTNRFLEIGLQSHSTIQTLTRVVGVLAEVRLVMGVEELTVSLIHDVLVNRGMVFTP